MDNGISFLNLGTGQLASIETEKVGFFTRPDGGFSLQRGLVGVFFTRQSEQYVRATEGQGVMEGKMG